MGPGELGATLERLPGVLAATVFTDAAVPTRVYLAVRPDADADAILATVQAILDDHGHAIDPDRIHVGAAPRSPRPTSALALLSLDGIDIHRTDNRVECTVTLRIPGAPAGAPRTAGGTAFEPDTPHGRARAAARATLAAAETADPALRLGLHGIHPYDLFGYDTIAVLVEVSMGRDHVQLPGSALVDRSPEQSAALATLQALRSWPG